MVGTEACGGQLAIGPTRLARLRRRGLRAVETRYGRRPQPTAGGLARAVLVPRRLRRCRPRQAHRHPAQRPGVAQFRRTPAQVRIEPGDNAGRHPADAGIGLDHAADRQGSCPVPRAQAPARPPGAAPARSRWRSPVRRRPRPAAPRPSPAIAAGRGRAAGTTTTRRSAPQVRAAGPSSDSVTPPRRRRTGLRAAPARCRGPARPSGTGARATVPAEETGEPLRPPRRPHRGIGEPPCLRTPAWSPSSASDSSMPASKARMAQQGLARRAHHHAVEAQSRQVHASLPFQRGDVSAGGRQRPVRGSGGTGEAARFRHPHEQGQGSDIRQHRRWPGAAGADDHAGPACTGGRPAQRAARAACCSSRVRATLSRR